MKKGIGTMVGRPKREESVLLVVEGDGCWSYNRMSKKVLFSSRICEIYLLVPNIYIFYGLTI